MVRNKRVFDLDASMPYFIGASLQIGRCHHVLLDRYQRAILDKYQHITLGRCQHAIVGWRQHDTLRGASMSYWLCASTVQCQYAVLARCKDAILHKSQCIILCWYPQTRYHICYHQTLSTFKERRVYLMVQSVMTKQTNDHLQVKKGICDWLARIVRMNRPKNCAPPTPTHAATTVKKSGSKRAQLTAELLQQRSSRSLLANVLDLEDDLLLLNFTGVKLQVVDLCTRLSYLSFVNFGSQNCWS